MSDHELAERRLAQLRRLEDFANTSCAEDEGRALALMVERSRLVLYGSIGTVGAALAAAWSGERAICTASLTTGVSLCLMGAGLAFMSLQFAETHYYMRVVRHRAQQNVLSDRVVEPTAPDLEEALEFSQAQRTELGVGGIARWLQVSGAVATMIGVALLAKGAITSIAGKQCWVFIVWPFTLLN